MKKTWKEKGVGIMAQCVDIRVDGIGFTAFRLYGTDKGYLDVVIDIKGNEVAPNSELWNKCVAKLTEN